MRKPFLLLLVSLSLAVLPASLRAEDEERRALWRDTFERVVKKLQEHGADLGVDLAAIARELRPRLDTIKDDAGFHALLSEMLGRFPRSHFALIPPGAYGEEEEGAGSAATPTPAPESRPASRPARRPRVRGGEGTAGLEVLLVEGEPTIARVTSDGPADKAGLRPGFVVLEVDEIELPKLAERIALRTKRDALRSLYLAGAVHGLFSGTPGDEVFVRYRDGGNEVRETTLRLAKDALRITTKLGELPEIEVAWEKRTLRGGVGYVRFNAFFMPLLEPVRSAIRSFKGAPAVVLDLRGNMGGLGAMAPAIAGLFTCPKGTSLGTSKMSMGEIRFAVFPRADALDCPLAVLVDERSASTAEILAAGLQEAGRAVVVGTPSAGAVLLSMVEKLPTGARLQLAFGDYKTPKGRALEGEGAIPDLVVPLARSSLLRGEDNVIEAALRLLEKERKRD